MTDSGFGSAPTNAQLQSILTTTPPVVEGTSPAVGSGNKASRDDHVHARLTSSTVQTLGTGGNVTVTFTRAFAAMPGVICTAYKPNDNLPVSFEVSSWVRDASNNYIGCVIHGSKAQQLPVLTSILLLGGLTGALTGFNPSAGDAAGTQFSCVAIQVSN